MIQLRLWKMGASSQPTGLRANTLSPLAPTSGATCIWEMSPIANQPGVIPSRRPSTDVSNRCRRGKNASPQKNAVVWHFGWVDFGDKLSNHFSHLPNPVVRVQNALQSKCFLHSRVGYSMLLFSCLHAVATGPLRCKTDQQTTWTLYLLNCKSWTLNDFLILFGTSALCSANHSLIYIVYVSTSVHRLWRPWWKLADLHTADQIWHSHHWCLGCLDEMVLSTTLGCRNGNHGKKHKYLLRNWWQLAQDIFHQQYQTGM